MLFRSVTSLTYPSNTYVASVSDIANTFQKGLSTKQKNIKEVKECVYILGRIGQFYDTVYGPNADYKKWRSLEYPSVIDQLDMIWHAMDNGEIPKANTFFEARASVKEKYPKNNPK